MSYNGKEPHCSLLQHNADRSNFMTHIQENKSQKEVEILKVNFVKLNILLGTQYYFCLFINKKDYKHWKSILKKIKTSNRQWGNFSSTADCFHRKELFSLQRTWLHILWIIWIYCRQASNLPFRRSQLPFKVIVATLSFARW